MDVHLSHLIDKLNEEGHWTQQLSGGEQQRLSMARVFLKQARWVFADEATSALDEALEQAMYEKLLAMVHAKNGALVSVAHRPSVAAFHTQQWLFQAAPADNAAKFVVTFSASSATNP
jgi:putative ATP-binding cassette transporter